MDMEIQPVPWWNRRSRMERRFIYSIATLLLVSVGLAIGNCNLGEKKIFKSVAPFTGGFCP